MEQGFLCGEAWICRVTMCGGPVCARAKEDTYGQHGKFCGVARRGETKRDWNGSRRHNTHNNALRSTNVSALERAAEERHFLLRIRIRRCALLCAVWAPCTASKRAASPRSAQSKAFPRTKEFIRLRCPSYFHLGRHHGRHSLMQLMRLVLVPHHLRRQLHFGRHRLPCAAF